MRGRREHEQRGGCEDTHDGHSSPGAQSIAIPPFTCKVWPVTYPASLLAR
jgi:hypothetical protein